jgi:hypothetical protein
MGILPSALGLVPITTFALGTLVMTKSKMPVSVLADSAVTLTL